MVWVVEGRVVAIMESFLVEEDYGLGLDRGLGYIERREGNGILYNGDRVARIGGSQPGVGE